MNVKLHNVFSNQKQYFVDGTNITSTYDNIYNVSNISNSGIGNTDISSDLQYLITGLSNNPLFDNSNNLNNYWIFHT